jgi:predicted hotdog family 3-hydroxylacyl-ACP dehydratase
MLADKTNIENYIPQRPPVVMVHELVMVSEDTAVSKFFVEPDNIFVENNLLTEAGLIENIGQTAAAHSGYLHHSQDLPAPRGFMAAVKNLIVYDLPVIHSGLETKVVITNRVFDIVIVRGVVHQGQKELCRCEMKILLKPS